MKMWKMRGWTRRWEDFVITEFARIGAVKALQRAAALSVLPADPSAVHLGGLCSR
jgi:hypothetical protein